MIILCQSICTLYMCMVYEGFYHKSWLQKLDHHSMSIVIFFLLLLFLIFEIFFLSNKSVMDTVTNYSMSAYIIGTFKADSIGKYYVYNY